MRGTIRTFDEAMRDDIHERVTTLAEAIAARLARRLHASASHKNYPVTVNDPALTEAMVPTLQRVAGARQGAARAQGHRLGGLLVLPAGGAGPVLLRRRHAAGHRSREGLSNHSPRFFVDERGLLVGVRALAQLTCDYLELHA